MDPQDIQQIERLIDDDDKKGALDRLLAIAPDDPLDDDLHALLDRAVPDHRFRTEGLHLNFWKGFRSVENFCFGRYRDQPYLLLYALPEMGDLGPAAEPRLVREGLKKMQEKEFLTIPNYLHGYMPFHPPTRGTYDWYEPRVRERDGILTIQQVSVFNGRRKSTDDARLSVYRVKGCLFRGRWVRYHEG